MAKETEKKKVAAKAADKKTAKSTEKKVAAKPAAKTATKTAEKKSTAKSTTAAKKTAEKAVSKKTTAKVETKKTAEKTTAKVATAKTATKKGDSSKLDVLIKAAIADGKITDAERKVLEKRAKEEGFDKDELNMILDAKLAETKDSAKTKQETTKKKDDKKDAKDPFDGLMVTVEGGIYECAQHYDKYHYGWTETFSDKRRKPIIHKEYWTDELLTVKIRLSSYKISKYLVTQAQWKAIMGKDNNPSHFKGDDLPVECVSWNDAQEFIKKLNEKTGKHYSLPTEAQWEFAARGGNESKNYECAGCDHRNLDDYAWHKGNSFNTTNPVGKKKPNELGLYDMNGNVWEWCLDKYRAVFPEENMADPCNSGDEALYKVIRGGGYTNENAWHNIFYVNERHTYNDNRYMDNSNEQTEWRRNRRGEASSSSSQFRGFRIVLLP